MARITYGVYLEHAPHCYVISNAFTDFAEDIVPETFSNPPITMKVIQHEYPNDLFLSGDAIPTNHPDVVKHALAIVGNQFPDWRLTGINVSVDGVYLICSTSSFQEEACSDGYITINGCYVVEFDLHRPDENVVERYRIKHSKDADKGDIIEIIEYVANRKRRRIEMQSDGHGMKFINGKQYCVITEY